MEPSRPLSRAWCGCGARLIRKCQAALGTHVWGDMAMRTEMGEYVVGAYLKQVLACDFVDYNVRPPVSGLEGLAEIDVLGLRFSDDTAYVCEVTTHLDGLQYGTYSETIKRLRGKYARQKQYAHKHLTRFRKVHFMFWSPVVREGALTKALSELAGLELIVNAAYTDRVRELQQAAMRSTRDTGNPFFRVLQLLAHLRPGSDGKRAV